MSSCSNDILNLDLELLQVALQYQNIEDNQHVLARARRPTLLRLIVVTAIAALLAGLMMMGMSTVAAVGVSLLALLVAIPWTGAPSHPSSRQGYFDGTVAPSLAMCLRAEDPDLARFSEAERNAIDIASSGKQLTRPDRDTLQTLLGQKLNSLVESGVNMEVSDATFAALIEGIAESELPADEASRKAAKQALDSDR